MSLGRNSDDKSRNEIHENYVSFIVYRFDLAFRNWLGHFVGGLGNLFKIGAKIIMKWKPIKTAPRDGTKVDLWLSIYASPRSFGMSDSYREIDCWCKDGKWVHFHEGQIKELYSPYVTHWRPIPKDPD